MLYKKKWLGMQWERDCENECRKKEGDEGWLKKKWIYRMENDTSKADVSKVEVGRRSPTKDNKGIRPYDIIYSWGPRA